MAAALPLGLWFFIVEDVLSLTPSYGLVFHAFHGESCFAQGEDIILVFLAATIFHLSWLHNWWVSAGDPSQMCFSELLRGLHSARWFNEILKEIDAGIEISPQGAI